jgi:DNA mismatch repair protein MutS
MLRQYFEMKNRVPDAILLYRMGDFYEMFFDDAKDAAPLLGIALTARHKDSDIEAPMCGVPHQSVDHHVAKLVAAGRKVAICDQVEDARAARGLVRRDITRVVTPGTVLDPESLLPDAPCYLAALARAEPDWGVAFLDLSTGRFHAGLVPGARIPDALALFRPREILVADGDEAPEFGAAVSRRSAAWWDDAARGESAGLPPPGNRAAGAALAYARQMRPGALLHVGSPQPLAFGEQMGLDAAAIATLELFESSDGSTSRSLFAILDRTRTPLGARALREALSHPSRDPVELAARWDAVDELVQRRDAAEALQAQLERVGDLERRFARVAVGTAGPREVAALAAGLKAVPAVLAAAGAFAANRFRALCERVPDTVDCVARVEAALSDDPPVLASAGGVIREGADAELDQLRELRSGAQKALLAIEAEERKRSGISGVRVRFNRVFGYSLEVSNAHKEKVPADWIRKQSLANAERFITPALKELEEKILGAEDRIAGIENRLYAELLAELAQAGERVAATAATVAQLDLSASFAEIAASAANRWVRPELSKAPCLSIAEGRHPLVERLRRQEPFIPNDCDLAPDRRILLVTGPNMGGKSTYLRQVATIVLLAQAGSFVPAAKVRLSPIDRIFTRVGAADYLSRGESTFMVEMLESASILAQATPSSLVILDEVGRGTSTFDGLSIAWALLEYLHDSPEKNAFVLFATHYHELTEIALVKPAVVNATMAVKELDGRVLFLRKVVPGAADRSYGIHVAELAGLPAEVTARAREVLANLDKQELDVQGAPVLARRQGESAGSGQFQLFSAEEELALDKLRAVDIDQMTPVSALSLLAALQDRLKGVTGQTAKPGKAGK